MKIGNYKLRISVSFAVIFFIGILFIVEAVQNCIVLNNWNNNSILEYTGKYTIHIRETMYHNNYIFSLDNGDKIEVPCEHIDNDAKLQNSDRITFRYVKYKSLFKFGRHTGIYIVASDEGVVFLKEEFSKHEIQLAANGYLIISLPCLIVGLFPLWSKLGIYILCSPKKKK